MILQNHTILQSAALIVFLKRNRRQLWLKLSDCCSAMIRGRYKEPIKTFELQEMLSSNPDVTDGKIGLQTRMHACLISSNR
jgi:hypothetical protein